MSILIFQPQFCCDIMMNTNLGKNSLTGTIPTQLGALNTLTTLDMGKRHIFVNLIGNMDSLMRLQNYTRRIICPHSLICIVCHI